MDHFIQKYESQVKGTLSGWDRIVFRGYIRTLAYVLGMTTYLQRIGCLLKDFGEHAQAMTEQLLLRSLQRAERFDRPVQYIASSSLRKEDYARNIAQADGITDGLVAVLTCVEPCRSFEIYRNKNEKKLELVARNRKCKYIYHYEIHPDFGFMYTRIQTWFPFTIQVGMNGREYLARQMNKQGMAYTRSGNCFPDIENLGKAQRLMDKMHKIDWPKTLDRIRRTTHPAHESMFKELGLNYYWSAHQTEWATELSKGFTKGGKRYRGIRLFSEEDVKLLEAIGCGDWVVGGFRNGDIAERLYGVAADKKERTRRSSRLSYRFRLLRAHGLIRKIPRHKRDQVSAKGRELITAILQLQKTNLQQLKSLPA